MCKDCGCSIVEHSHEHHDHHHDHQGHHHHEHIHDNPQLNDKKTIDVITKILDKNDEEARHNREHFDAKGVLCINLMSSPGSGKTALLEALADLGAFRFSVVEGDLETSRDAERLHAKSMPLWCTKRFII